MDEKPKENHIKEQQLALSLELMMPVRSSPRKTDLTPDLQGPWLTSGKKGHLLPGEL